MFRSVVFTMILLTASFTGCTDSTPNRTIVTFQIDSDGEDFWIYLYTVPRTKMGNFSIESSLGNDIAPLVYSYQKKVSFDDLTKDSDNFVSFSFKADLSEVFWELNCKFRLNQDSTDERIVLDVLIIEGEEEKGDEWKLPYSTPLNYRQ
ncbi:MAG: hypothetical protein ACJZ4D_03375 [Candidatus Poseidoniales archaeon]|tara:strand:+ start:257 stop:703 length:447 start_codon:yes stop_codon:yes gene_type:complete